MVNLYIMIHILNNSRLVLVLIGFLSIALAINSILMARKFILAFYVIKMMLNKRGLKIVGGELNITAIWEQLNVVSVELILVNRSMIDALVLRLTDSREYKIVDRYTKSPQELLATLRAFSQKNGIDVTFYWKDKTLSC